MSSKISWDLIVNEIKRNSELERKYRDISLQIAKLIIDEINKTFRINYDIKILVGYPEAKKELKGEFPYNEEAATPVLRNNTVYIITGDTYYHNALNTTEEIKGSPEDIPFPPTIAHEYLHIVLEKVLPKTQERRLGLDKILGESVPMWEFWTELFTNLFWRKVYGNKIPEHRYKLSDLPKFYVNDINEILREQSKIPKLEERLRKLEETRKLFEKGYKYVVERNGEFFGINLNIPEGSEIYNSKDILMIKLNSLEFRKRFKNNTIYDERIEKLKEALRLFEEGYKTIVITPNGKVVGYEDKILTKEEVEINYFSIGNEIENIKREYPLWWIPYDKAYLFADLVAEELWKKYKEKSIDLLIERLKKYNNAEEIIDKDVLSKALESYRSILS